MDEIFVGIIPDYDLKKDDYVYPIQKLSIFTSLRQLDLNVFLYFSNYKQEGFIERLSDIHNVNNWIDFEYIYARKPKVALENDSDFKQHINNSINNFYSLFKTKQYTFEEFINLPDIKNINDVLKYFYYLTEKGDFVKETINEKFKVITSDHKRLKDYYENEYYSKSDRVLLTPEFEDESIESKDIESAFNNVYKLGSALLSQNPSIKIIVNAPTIFDYRAELATRFYKRVMQEEKTLEYDDEMRHWEEMARDEENSMDRETDGFWRDF